MGSPKLDHPRGHDLKITGLNLLCSVSSLPHAANIHCPCSKLALDSSGGITRPGVNLHWGRGTCWELLTLYKQQMAQMQLDTPMSNYRGNREAFRKAVAAKICLAQVCKRTYISTQEGLLLMQLKWILHLSKNRLHKAPPSPSPPQVLHLWARPGFGQHSPGWWLTCA